MRNIFLTLYKFCGKILSVLKISTKGGKMGILRERHWLSDLPVTGHDILIRYKNGSVQVFGWGRIESDGKVIIITLLEMPKGDKIPTIAKIKHIHRDDVEEITLSEDSCPDKIRSFKRSDISWLANLPKSRNCHIFVTCEQWEESKEVFKGWIEYDTERIYLREIIRSRKNAETGKMTYEVADHTRSLGDVIAIFISVNDQPVEVFVRTIAEEPVYR